MSIFNPEGIYSKIATERDRRAWHARSWGKLKRWSQSHTGDVTADPHPQYVLEGYGGLLKATDTNYGVIGDGDWTTIDNWDAGMIPDPVGVIQDVANSGLRVQAAGKYRLSGNFAISFIDENRGRVFGVRLYDATSGTPSRVVEYFVGRNQEGVNLSQAALLTDVPEPDVNALLQIQIAGVGDTFADVAVIDALYSVARVG